MGVVDAITDLVRAILSIVSGLFNAVFAFIHGILALIKGTVTGTASVTKEGLDLIFGNIGILLIVGASILAYQIFIVERGRAPRVTNKVGGGRKKIA